MTRSHANTSKSPEVEPRECFGDNYKSTFKNVLLFRSKETLYNDPVYHSGKDQRQTNKTLFQN